MNFCYTYYLNEHMVIQSYICMYVCVLVRTYVYMYKCVCVCGINSCVNYIQKNGMLLGAINIRKTIQIVYSFIQNYVK